MIFRSPFDTATAVHREHLLRQRAVERVSRADIDQGGWSTLLPLDRAAESWWGLSSLFLLRDGFREGFDDHSPDTVDVAGNGNTRLLIGLCGEPSKPSLCGHGQPGPTLGTISRRNQSLRFFPTLLVFCQHLGGISLSAVFFPILIVIRQAVAAKPTPPCCGRERSQPLTSPTEASPYQSAHMGI